jgi:hypothetical protein
MLTVTAVYAVYATFSDARREVETANEAFPS